jgi:type II secretory pathway component GspD/PulD (secretin)
MRQAESATGRTPGCTPAPRAAAGSRFPPAACASACGLVAGLLIAGCAEIRPYVPPSEGHIPAPAAKAAPQQDIPPPARVSTFVPPPKPAVKPQTYSVVVNEVPVKELLLALARDTKQNIDIHSGLSGLVSMNAINETLPAILDRIAKQVNLRYRVEGNTIIVSPDTPFVKTYHLNYVNMTRDTTSTTGVSGQISVTAGTGGQQSGGQPGSGGAGGNTSTTTVTTRSDNDFWKLVEGNVRQILNSSLQQTLSSDAKKERIALLKAEQEAKAKQIDAAGRAGQGASALATAMISPPGTQQTVSLLADDVVVNRFAGTITVNGTDSQHRLVQEYLDSVSRSVQRQVLIEATIVEVRLSDAYQGGVDWSRIGGATGFTFRQALLTGFGGGLAQLTQLGANFLQIGYANPRSDVGNITAPSSCCRNLEIPAFSPVPS